MQRGPGGDEFKTGRRGDLETGRQRQPNHGLKPELRTNQATEEDDAMNTSQTTNDATRRRSLEIEDVCETVLEAPVYDREDPPSHASLVAAYVALTDLAQDLAARVKEELGGNAIPPSEDGEGGERR